MDIQTASRDELIAAIPSVLWYHAIEVAPGVVTPGVFDLRPHLPAYGFPDDMRGMSVLDVGPASGFFSFEFERRGAEVTALELPSPLDKDFVGGDRTVELMRAINAGHRALKVDIPGQRMDFPIAHRLLNSKIECVYARIYDVPAALNGRMFDLAFCGSILNHLASPMAALSAVRAVAKSIIVANPYDPDSDQTKPAACLVGRRSRGLTTWWLPTIACMKEMLSAAGFTDIEVVSENLRLAQTQGGPIPHFVMSAKNDESHDRWKKELDLAPQWEPERLRIA